MNKIWMALAFASLAMSSLTQAASKANKFEFGVGCTVANMVSVQTGSKSSSEIVTRVVPEASFEYRPSWYGLKVSALIGNTSTYDLGEVSEMTLPTVMLKGYKSIGYIGIGGYYQGVSGSYQATSGSTKTSYTTSSGGLGPILELGLKSPSFFGGLSAELGVQYMPLSKIEIDWSASDRTIINKPLSARFGINYAFF